MTRHCLRVAESDRVRDARRHADLGLAERTRVVLVQPVDDPENVQQSFNNNTIDSVTFQSLLFSLG